SAIAARCVQPATIKIDSEETIDQITFSFVEQAIEPMATDHETDDCVVAAFPGCQNCRDAITACGGTLVELDDFPWRIRFSLPRFL
ncbi:MAG: hypothetical protein KDB27_30740, partial [Planctomycetales bacterium]|nr:hypothetical protein [Planctomycetales bacterium]